MFGGSGFPYPSRAVALIRTGCVCVCVCVKTPRNTVKWFFNNFTAGGRRGWGGSPVQTYLHFRFSVWIAGAKLLEPLRFIFPGTTTTGLFLRWCSYFRTMLYIFGMRPTSYRCPTSHYTRQPCRTLISVCQSSGCYVIPAGWTFREGPVSWKPQLMFPNGTREAIVPWIKGRTPGPSEPLQPVGHQNLRTYEPFRRWEAFQPLIKDLVSPLILCLEGIRWTRSRVESVLVH